MPPIVSITFCICLSVTGGRLPAPTNIIINSPTCQAELVMRADDIRDQSHSAPGWMRGEKAVSNVCQTSLSLTISHWNLVFHCYYRHRRDPLCVSVCLSVCFLSSYYPIWPASHYKPIRRTYNTISHLQPPLRPLSSFYYSQPGAGQQLVKTETLFGPKYHMQDGEAQPGHDLGLLIRKQAIFINWSNKHQIHIYSALLYVHHFFYLCPSIVSLFIFIENICIRKEKGCF